MRVALAFIAVQVSVLAVSGTVHAASPSAAIGSNSKDLSSYSGWIWYTNGEPQPRISVLEAAADGFVMKHGYVSMYNLGGRWFDTIQEIKPVGSNQFGSTYRYQDGRVPLTTTLTWQSDGSLLEEFRDERGMSYRNIISFQANTQITERSKLEGGVWSRINVTKKDGWSPQRQ